MHQPGHRVRLGNDKDYIRPLQSDQPETTNVSKQDKKPASFRALQ